MCRVSDGGYTGGTSVVNEVLTPAAVGSLLGWIAAGLPTIMAGDHQRADRYVSHLLYTAGPPTLAGGPGGARSRRLGGQGANRE